jgi:hypothetical protein
MMQELMGRTVKRPGSGTVALPDARLADRLRGSLKGGQKSLAESLGNCFAPDWSARHPVSR